MKSRELLEAMGEISENYIEEADEAFREMEGNAGEVEAESKKNSVRGDNLEKGNQKKRRISLFLGASRRGKPFRQNGAAVAAACILMLVVGGVYGKIRRDMSPMATAYRFDRSLSEEFSGGRSEMAAAAPEAAVEGKSAPTQIENPYEDFTELEEAEEAAGFHIALVDSFREYTELSYSVLYGETAQSLSVDAPASGNMIEVIYRNKSGEEGLRIRMERRISGGLEREADKNQKFSEESTETEDDKNQKFSEESTETEDDTDISGDYRSFPKDEIRDFSGLPVRLRGEGERIELLSWSTADFSYAISVAEGISEKEEALLMNTLVGTLAKSEEMNHH